MDSLARARSPWSADLAAATLLVAFGLLVWPALLSGRGADPRRPDDFRVAEAADQVRYHLPTVQAFAEQMPTPDLSNYRSATTPGLHLLLASMKRWVTLGETDLRFFASLFSLALLYVAWRFASNLAGAWAGAALVAPLLGCRYFLGGAIWLMTDNAATLFCALALATAVFAPARGGWLALGGVWATLAVLVRQTSLWVVGAPLLAGVLATPLARLAPAALRPEPGRPLRWRGLALASPALLAPFVVVALFFALWGGTTPPMVRHATTIGPNLAAPAVALSIVGVFGLFFLPLFVRSFGELARTDAVTTGAVALGLLCAVAPATSYDFALGRSGGPLWEFVRKFGAVGDRSLLLGALAPLGAWVLVHAWRGAARAGRAREASILLVCMLGWTLTLVAGKLAFQRYFEPTILLALAWMGAMAACGWRGSRAGGADDGRSPLIWAGPVALGVVHLAASVVTVYLPIIQWRPPA